MTQKHDQINSNTIATTTPSTNLVKLVNAVPSVFEQMEIQNTLTQTALKPEQLTLLRPFFKIITNKNLKKEKV